MSLNNRDYIGFADYVLACIRVFYADFFLRGFVGFCVFFVRFFCAWILWLLRKNVAARGTAGGALCFVRRLSCTGPSSDTMEFLSDCAQVCQCVGGLRGAFRKLFESGTSPRYFTKASVGGSALSKN
jgi:hypothetical protein